MINILRVWNVLEYRKKRFKIQKWFESWKGKIWFWKRDCEHRGGFFVFHSKSRCNSFNPPYLFKPSTDFQSSSTLPTLKSLHLPVDSHLLLFVCLQTFFMCRKLTHFNQLVIIANANSQNNTNNKPTQTKHLLYTHSLWTVHVSNHSFLTFYNLNRTQSIWRSAQAWYIYRKNQSYQLVQETYSNVEAFNLLFFQTFSLNTVPVSMKG